MTLRPGVEFIIAAPIVGKSAKGLLQPYSQVKMTYYAVDSSVGNVKNNSPECIKPVP
jgi:putative SOS response-associated peptidase YedK